MSRNQTKKQANGGARPPKGTVPKQQRKRSPPLNNKPRGTSALGARSTSVAAAYSSQVRSNNPKIQYGRNGKSCRVQHKEFIQNVTGTTNFTVALFLALNPGLVGTFPWLANIANNFEQYRAHMVRFCYLTRTGTNIPGSVLLAPDYDASDVQPLSEQIMSNYAEIVEDAPWKDLCCNLRPSGMHALGPKKFVRSGPVAGQDLKTTDIGTFILATVDGTAVNWGKLWVEYDFEFFEPQLNPQGSLLGSSAQGTAGTVANPINTGLVIAGPLITGIVGQILTLQNLIPGAEYHVSYGGTVFATGCAIGATTGAVDKTTLLVGANDASQTFIATAGLGGALPGTATLTLVPGGVSTNPLIVVTQITLGAL
jgi:hypothetical protein